LIHLKVNLSTLVPRNRHQITKRAKISTKSLYEGLYTAQSVVDVSRRYKEEAQDRIQRVSEEFWSDTMMLDQELDDIDTGRDVLFLEQSVDTQVLGEDTLMSDQNLNSIAAEDAVLEQEQSLNCLAGEADVLARRQPESVGILASQLGRYEESVTPITAGITGGHKMLEGREPAIARWRKSLKKKRVSLILSLNT